jgi:hypothetical protein
MRPTTAWPLALLPLLFACGAPPPATTAPDLRDPREVRLRNVRQLTFSGENAEAYWSPDGSRLVFQAHDGEGACDRFTDGRRRERPREVSSGGRSTTAYFRTARASCSPPRAMPAPNVSGTRRITRLRLGLYDYDLYVAEAGAAEPGA